MGDRRLTNTGQSHETVSTSTTTDPLSVWGVYGAIVKSTQPRGTPQSAAIVEVQRYMDSPVISRSEDPLAWWRENQYIFPNMSKVVREKFNIVATSVPCERIFSKTGIIINERRTRLKASKVEKLIFLNMDSTNS
ncbi:E3 SUMO-protein ligase ZBED1-like [Schistocerca nitens]|uniref:E3 SUMO-protein ligase ZBED1-like n=1 Tax=Schistocerca nitens TaxID=7011 RepID=UPI0021174307|nr:E3 SUMO-protein ligase ZBED1-like [Schistocerca nitens]